MVKYFSPENAEIKIAQNYTEFAQDVYYAILDDESGSCVVVTDVVDYV